MSEIRVTTLTDTSGGNSSTTADIFSGRAKVWVNFNGVGTVAIRTQFNVNSVTDNGTGHYTVNFSTTISDANYVVTGTCERDGTNSDNPLLSHRTRATTSVVINTSRANTDLFDMIAPTIAIFR